MFILHKDGHLEVLDNDLHNPNLVFTDYLPVPEFKETMSVQNISQRLPANGVMEVKFGYEDTFRYSFGSEQEANSFVDQLMPHMQAYYCLPSLGTQVKVQVIHVTMCGITSA